MVPVNIYLVYNLYLPVLFPFISCSLDFILILSFTRWTYFDLLSRRDMPLHFSCHWYIYCVESCGDFLSSSITASSPHDLSWKGLAEDFLPSSIWEVMGVTHCVCWWRLPGDFNILTLDILKFPPVTAETLQKEMEWILNWMLLCSEGILYYHRLM